MSDKYLDRIKRSRLWSPMWFLRKEHQPPMRFRRVSCRRSVQPRTSSRNARRLRRTQLDHESGSPSSVVVASAQPRRGDSPIHPRSVNMPASDTESDDENMIQGPSRPGVRRSGSLDEGRDPIPRRLRLLP